MHDKHGRALEQGDWVRFGAYGPSRLLVGRVYHTMPASTSCNLRAVAVEVLSGETAPGRAATMPLGDPMLMGQVRPLAVVVESGWLNAHETELLATVDGQPLDTRGPAIVATPVQAVAPSGG